MGKIFNLSEVVLNWPTLFTPKASKMYPNNPPRYSVNCAVPVNSPDHHAIVNAINETAAEFFPEGNCSFPIMKPSPDGTTIEVRSAAAESNPPGVIDGQKNEILNPGEIYSGVVANVAIDVYASVANRRVCIGLLGVQKVKDGPRMDNKPDTSELFSPIATVNTLQPGAAPIVPKPPTASFLG